MRNIFLKKSDTNVVKIQVGKILCLGKNYKDHAIEMGGEVPKTPMIFMKPSTAITEDGVIEIPQISNEMHHEVELAILIGKEAKKINQQDSEKYILGYGVGLDMTLRDQQHIAKKEGTPWTIAKAFDMSAVFGNFIPMEEINNAEELDIELKVNGALKQKSNTRNMVFKINFTITYLSQIFTLEPGDIIMMGTPEGVGKVVSGDRLEGKIEGLPPVNATIK